MASDLENLNITENDIFVLAQKARGVHAAAIYVSESGLTQPMADGVAALVGGLCDDLEKLLVKIDPAYSKTDAGAA